MTLNIRTFMLWLVGLILVTQVATAALPLNWFSEKDEMPTLAPMLERSKPAVVNIATRSEVKVQDNPLLNDPFFRHFFDLPEQPRTRPRQSLGSGVIIDAKQGLVITNNHVIRGADEITVSLTDGRNFQAEIVGSDPATDVALIKISSDDLTALPLADSESLRVGDFVVAIGNPFGLGQTVTSGIVSALGRSGLGIEGYENFIQTDASINPGNSGGALVNLRGELVGINTAIFSPGGASAGNIGIGFAIPSNLVKQISDQLLEHGEVKRAYLGVQMQDITPELAQAFAIDVQQGAVVTHVVPDSAADVAGLRVGDIITAVDGAQLINADSLRNTIGLMMVGQKVKLDIIRDGKDKTLIAKVKQTRQTEESGTVHPKLAGATFGDIEEDSPYFGRVEGVMVYSVKRGSPAWNAGLRSEDVVTSVNRRAVKNLEEFKPMVKNTEQVLLNIIRGRRAMFLLLK
ncbi:DegQ family serine endoprotease [Methylophaga sp.]|uniref:DegQ family serine endoprotease n=1 Tax=Methylophaga sp. TaxID=2024840 RepID=UPI003F698CB6